MLVFGQEGVEQTLPSQATVGTAALFFLANKDSLLRITSVRPLMLPSQPGKCRTAGWPVLHATEPSARHDCHDLHLLSS